MMGPAATPAAADTAGVLALIALITSPELAAARMRAIQDASDAVISIKVEAEARIAEADARMEQVRLANESLDLREKDNLADVERCVKDRAQLDRTQAYLEEREKAIEATKLKGQADIYQREQSLAMTKAEFLTTNKAQEDALAAATAKLVERERAAAEMLVRAEAMRAEYTKRLDGLREMVN